MDPPKSTDVFCNPLIGRWQLTTSWCSYLLICLLIQVSLRAFQSLFKASALKYDDVREGHKLAEAEKSKGYGRVWWYSFTSFRFRKNSDLLLPTLIGFVELTAYPILMVIGQYLFIGAWLGIKTAGAWKGWRTSQTAYNRFLLFNLLNLVVAYSILTHFVRYMPCP